MFPFVDKISHNLCLFEVNCFQSRNSDCDIVRVVDDRISPRIRKLLLFFKLLVVKLYKLYKRYKLSKTKRHNVVKTLIPSKKI